MTASVSQYNVAFLMEEENNLRDFGDDQVAHAELLAAQALKAAEEARRAAERLAEVKASIALLNRNRSPVSKPLLVMPVAARTRSSPIDAPAAATSIEQKEQTTAPSPPVVATPAPVVEASKLEPVAEQQAPNPTPTTELQSVPVQPRQVAPVVVPAQVPVATEVVAAPIAEPETDLFVRMLDALGVDKMCGLDDETLQATLKHNDISLDENVSQNPPAPAVVVAPIAPVAPAAVVSTQPVALVPTPTIVVATTPTEAIKAPSPVAIAATTQPSSPTMDVTTVKSVEFSEVVSITSIPAREGVAINQQNADPPASNAKDVMVAASTTFEQQMIAKRFAALRRLRNPDPFEGEVDDICTCGDDLVFDPVVPYSPQAAAPPQVDPPAIQMKVVQSEVDDIVQSSSLCCGIPV